MTKTRRWISIVVLLLASTSYAELSVLQGYTDSTSTQISVLHEVSETILPRAYEVESNRRKFVRRTKFTRRFDSKWAISHYLVEGLNPKLEYSIAFHDTSGDILDQRFFSSIDTTRSRLRIAVASCMIDHLHKKKIWRNLAQENPDFLFMVGDNVYADMAKFLYFRDADPKQLWLRYSQTWRKLELFKFERLIPTISVWDDHDYGLNDGNRNYKYKSESRDNFYSFYAQDDYYSENINNGPGVSSFIELEHFNLAFLDARYFREEVNDDGVNPAGDHLGPMQLSWLRGRLASSQRSTLFISGVHFFGDYHNGESYKGQYFLEFNRFKSMVKKHPYPSLFISGDRHYSEVQEIEKEFFGYRTYEFTSSGIHTSPHLKNTKSKRRTHFTRKSNFMLIDITSSENRLLGTATSVGTKELEIFKADFESSL